MSRPELLAPAGSPEALDAAVGEGADGVYLGLKSFNARMRSANFSYSQFEGALRSLHRMGRKVYVTVNTVFEERESDRMYQLLKYLAAVGPDGIILQDFGVLRMVRDEFPSLKMHASTQMNIASARGLNLLSKQGVSRVVLARELSLAEIRRIRGQTNVELEVFVHGALCLSASGLCLFSGFLGGKSANRGMCTQACRRRYQREGGSGYYFSPADLELVRDVPALADAGVNSLKIEGRMKSAEYVGVVVAAYRRVIDTLDGDREGGIREGLALLRGDYARKKTRFYFDRPPAWFADGPGFGTLPAPGIDWLNPEQDGGTGIALGTILKVRGGGEKHRALIPGGTTPLEIGDSLRFHRSNDTERLAHKLAAVEPAGAEGVAPAGDAADKPGGRWISLPEGFGPGDSVYLIQSRGMSKRYSQVIPRNLEAYKRCPGRDRAPLLTLPPVKKRDPRLFPEGIYVAVSRPEDLFILQSAPPVRVMLACSRRTVTRLLEEDGPRLPFGPRETIIVLDPYFPEAMDAPLGEALARLRALGYYQFVVNNPGQFAFFRDSPPAPAAPEAAPLKKGPASPGKIRPASLIAGPYLYTYNRRALAFVASLGTDSVVSPPENNRQNLERTVEPGRRSCSFVTVFSYPPLFRIRENLGEIYDFRKFQDARGEGFRLICGGKAGDKADDGTDGRVDGSLVIPERPFSIVDKIPFLREAGFNRFIVDLSGPPLKKKDYKDIMAAVSSGSPLPNISRFNWKDGFYTEEKGKVPVL
ncbi:MAG: U32 family peptidase [Spirochaetaceae bacterium]|jgi:putative protease|nr:U32 family peptidase [Spirochaetaceae bacterium]